MKRIVTTLAVFALVVSSQGGFILVDDMESGGYGTTWSTNGVGSGGFVVDTADPANTVLEGTVTSGQFNLSRTIPTISVGTTATLFLRTRGFLNEAGEMDWVFGASDSADPASIGWNAYEGYGRMAGTNALDLALDVRNTGGPDGAFSEVGSADSDTWYNVWFVLDNTANTTDMYYNTGMNDATEAGTISFQDGAFRRGDGNDLITLFVRNNKVGTVGQLDDVYIDLEGENLVNPIPEPATFGMMAIFGGAMLFFRRRFKS